MNRRLSLGAMLMALAIAGCGGSSSQPSSGGEIVIGDLHPITGSSAYYGAPESKAIRLAADEINQAGGVVVGGKKYTIRIDTEDDKNDPTAAVAAVKKMIDDNVHYIIGPLGSGVAPAIKPIVVANSDVTEMIDGATANGLPNGNNIFRNQASISDYDAGLIQLDNQKKYPTIAVMTDQFHSGYVGSQPSLLAAFGKAGSKVVDQEAYKLKDTDFSAQLTKIKGQNPSVLLVRGYAVESALITKQAHQLGFTGQIVWEVVAPPVTVAQTIPTTEMQGIFNSYPATVTDLGHLGVPAAKKMDSAYRAKYNEDPGELSALSYDSVYVLKAAFEKAGSTANAAVNKALRNIKVSDLKVVNQYKPQTAGLLFDDKGQAIVPGSVQVWQNLGWVPLTGVK